jgi:polyvinyl alcohol dehydrogenase (cytochrome)
LAVVAAVSAGTAQSPPYPQGAKVFAVDKNTGALLWSTQVDATALSCVTNSAVVVNNMAAGGLGAMPWRLKDGTTTTAGGWASLDARTGAVRWTTKDPQGSRAEAAVSSANGVVFGCNLAAGAGTMYALDANSGNVLWSYNSGGPCNAGPSVADGVVYWGSGTFNGYGPKKVFAFGF